MPAPELNPQVPGETSQPPAENTGVNREELKAIAGLKAVEVIDGLEAMTPAELVALREIEVETHDGGRVTVLRAIDAKLAPPTESTPPPAETYPAPTSDTPVRTDSQAAPKLSAEGWVVPEPARKAS